MSIEIAWFPDYGHLMAGIFDTFTKVRMCGQHPGRMSRVGVRVRSFFCFFLQFQSILSIFVLFLLFFGWKIFT